MENYKVTIEDKNGNVNKEHYHVHQFIGGYYGICETPSGSRCVFGGDSANDDDYNEDYMNDVYNQWNGDLSDGRIELN